MDLCFGLSKLKPFDHYMVKWEVIVERNEELRPAQVGSPRHDIPST